MTLSESSAPKATYTMEEVQKHRDKTSAWFVIHNDVYDVTKFLDDHPGGRDVLLAHSGTDATEAFVNNNHSRGAINMSKAHIIGQLDPKEAKKFFTMADIKEDKSSDDCLMCIHNIIYNLKDFRDNHPGGRDVINYQNGTDATEAFDGIGHSRKAMEMMKKYAVGELHPDERKNTKGKAKAAASGDNVPAGATAIRTASQINESLLGRVVAQLKLAFFAALFLYLSYIMLS